MKNKALAIVKTSLAVASFFGVATFAYAQVGPGGGSLPTGDTTIPDVGTTTTTLTCPTPSSTSWNGAPATPPNCNMPGPVNVGSATQNKNGILTVNGLASWGGSTLIGLVYIGPYDSCYFAPCSGGGSSGGSGGGSSSVRADSNGFAMREETKGFVASALNALKPNMAYAYGTSSTDKLYVNGTTRINGSLYTGPITMNATSGDFLVSPHAFSVSKDQGGSIELGGTNSLANTGGAVPYIDFHFGTGTVQDYNARIINSANGRLELAATNIYANGNLGVGDTAPSNKLSVNGTDPDGLLSLQSGGSTKWHLGIQNTNGDQFQIGDGATITPRLTIQKGSGDVNIVGRLGVGTNLHVAGSTSTNVLNANTANINKLNLAGAVPIYRQNNITGMTCNAVSNQNTSSANTGNPNTGLLAFGTYAMPPYVLTDYRYCYMSGAFRENTLIGYTIPAPASPNNNPLNIVITGMTTGAPDYVNNKVPATITFDVTGGGGFPVQEEWIYVRSGGTTLSIYLGPGQAVQPGSSGSVTFNSSAGGLLSCSPSSGTVTGYGINGVIKNTAGATVTGSTLSTGVGPC